jgi:YfiH family protein
MAAVRAEWQLRTADTIDYYELGIEPGLLLAFFTRRGGVSRDEHESLNLSYNVGDKDHLVTENFQRVQRAMRLPTTVTLRQSHSSTVLPIAYDRIPPDLLEGDASFTALPNVGLALRVADCLPVYIYARDLRSIGIAHCGWRGTAGRIAERLARTMSRRFAVPLVDLRFVLGPCICPQCYEVGDDVRDEFAAGFPAWEKFFTPGRPNHSRTRHHLDLRAANRWLLKEMGLSEMPSLGLCTAEHPDSFFSARRDEKTGRNLALIALRATAVPDRA